MADEVATRSAAHSLEARALLEATRELRATAERFDFREDDDNYFEQPGNLFRLMTQQERQDLCDNLAGPLSTVDEDILQRQLRQFDKADPAYGRGVRASLKALGRNAD